MTREKLSAFFQSDRGLLLASIGVALVFWLLNKMSQSYDSDVNVGVHYTLPDAKAFSIVPPTKLKAFVTSTGWDLTYQHFIGNALNIDLELNEQSVQNYTSGQFSALIQGQLPSHYKVTGVNQDIISLRLEDKTSKIIPIILNQDISFNVPYQLTDSIRFEPQSVEIFGPKSLIDQLSHIESQLLQLKGLECTERQDSIQLVSFKESLLTGEESLFVKVFIQADKFTEKKIVIPIQIKNAQDSIRVFPDKVQISFLTGFQKFESINRNDFQISVDLANIGNQEQNVLPLQLDSFPKHIKNISYSPKAVEYFLVK